MTHIVDVACLDPRPLLLRNTHSANWGFADVYPVGEEPIRSNRTLSSRNRHERLVTKLLVPQSESGNKRGSFVQCRRRASHEAGAPIESSKKQGCDGCVVGYAPLSRPGARVNGVQSENVRASSVGNRTRFPRFRAGR